MAKIARFPSAHAIGAAQLVAWGATFYALPPLLPEIMRDVGLSAASLSWAMTAGLVSSALGSVAVGAWIHRRGARAPMVVGTVVATLALVGMAASPSGAGVLAGLAILGTTSAMLLYEPAFAAVASRASDPSVRVHSIQIVTFWGGWAALWSIPAATMLAATWGWRAALVVLAVILVAETLPVHRRMPGRGSRGHAPARDVRCTTVVARRLASGFALGACATGIIVVHGIMFLADRGVDIGTASIAFAMMAPVQIGARVWFLRRRGRLTAADGALPFVLVAAGLLAMLEAPASAALVLFSALFGGGAGLLTTIRAGLVATLVPPDQIARELGAMSFVVGLARAGAPVIGATSYSVLGFHGSVIVTVVLVLAGAVLVASGVARGVRTACTG